MSFLGARRGTNRGGHSWLPAILPLALFGLSVSAGCYDTGDGTAPPLNRFYFPVGLRVSQGGTVLYAVNSDFDLQFNGGTLQSYDLRAIRQAALFEITNPPPGCPDDPPTFAPNGARQPLGETCAPPRDSSLFFRDSAVIGAFATDLLLSPPPPIVAPGIFDRLFVPVRGNATLTWADIERDTFESRPVPEDSKATYGPFRILCSQDASNRCDALHQVGDDPNEEGNVRNLTLPGEPFGAAISEDGVSLVMTHQNDQKTTLFSTGLSSAAPPVPPAIQFVADRVPVGGVGIAAIPHDPDAFRNRTPPNPAFLETSRAVAEVTLIRRYADEGASIPRPFINVETGFPLGATLASATDGRGIAIDPTPRLTCKLTLDPNLSEAERARSLEECGQRPARVFIATRSAGGALLSGEVGRGRDSDYNPDEFQAATNQTPAPLPPGASKVYLAPIVNARGEYELRVFVVCFDSASVVVFNPDDLTVPEATIRVAPGPFAMAFDPFTVDDIAKHAIVPTDSRDPNIKRYRFAYVASFTQSFVQVIDLDNQASPPTFERVVFTLGQPTNPKGT